MNKFLVTCILIWVTMSLDATHYSNKTGKAIVITNVSAQKRQNKKRKRQEQDLELLSYAITLEPDQEADLDNDQEDEITITSPGMNDKRKLFPTNNSFNYVITMNKYKKKFERFDINHAE
jgi:hypothetical protein